MKPIHVVPMMIAALGLGVFIGKSSSGKNSGPVVKTETRNGRETKVTRPSRNDPFGGPAFSLKSMDEVRELFRKQRGAVASARLTLGVEQLSARDLPDVMEMLQRDARDHPGYDQANYELMNTVFQKWALVDPDAAVAFAKSCKSRSFQMMAIGSCFSGLAQADPERAKMELARLPKGELRRNAGAAVISMLSEQDPEGAIGLLESEPSPGGFGGYYVGRALAKWAEKDPKAAAARLASMPKDRVDADSADALAASWAKSDPDAALAWAKTQKGDWKNNAARSVYRVLALNDPAAAWERLKSEPGHLRGKLIGSVLDVVADENPKQALAMLNGLQGVSEKRIATESFVQRLGWWGSENRELVTEVIDGMPDTTTRRNLLANQLGYLSWTSPDELKERVATLNEREKIASADEVLRGLVSSDPAGAEAYFLSLPESQRATRPLSYLMENYANRDPEKACKFALSLQNPQERTAAVNGLFSQWSQEDPEAAAEGWKKLPANQSRLEALDQIAGSWARNDPEAAKEWADGLTGNERARALAAVLPSMAQDHPANAASALAALISSAPDGLGKNMADSAGQLARQWAGDDPAAASKWAAGLPAGQARDEGLKAVSQSWSQYDAIATAEWLGTLEAGSSRDAAIQPLVEHVRDTDPNTAFSWASSISDENERLNQLRETLKAWRGSDLKAARAAFEAADLPAKDRASLAKELE